jgi:hypothetical protein
MVTNIPANMVVDQFGMIGLLTFIRAAETDPNLGRKQTKYYAGFLPVFRIRDILVRIQILGSVPLTNGSGCDPRTCSFRQ